LLHARRYPQKNLMSIPEFMVNTALLSKYPMRAGPI
jgi:predicted Rossmann fold nucleotide-binding protein DprA/Smf involved in DNA uptake